MTKPSSVVENKCFIELVPGRIVDFQAKRVQAECASDWSPQTVSGLDCSH